MRQIFLYSMVKRKRYGRSRRRSKRARGRVMYKAKRRRASNNSYNLVRHTRNPFPSNFFCKLQYASEFNLNPTSGVPAIYAFSANSLFDPNKTGFGEQPRYFDQLAALYGIYTVYGSKATVTFMNYGTTGSDENVLGIEVGDEYNVTRSLVDMVELPNIKTSYMGPSTGSQGVKTLSAKWSLKRFTGSHYTKGANFSAAVTASPSIQNYFLVSAIGLNGVDTGNIKCVIRISYFVGFTERIEVAQS